MNAPVILFVYNRPQLTTKTIQALRQNILAQHSDLIIFSDGWKGSEDKEAVLETRKILAGIDGFKTTRIINANHNRGLASSVISGVTKTLDKYGKVIVVEDDIITSPMFLSYMNEALDRYSNEPEVFSITGFNYPKSRFKIPQEYTADSFFGYRCHSWTWATWSNRWNLVDWEVSDYDLFCCDLEAQERFRRGGDDLTKMLDKQLQGQLDSWAIRFCYAHFKNDAYCLYPRNSLVRNLGFGNNATHCKNNDGHLYSSGLDQEWLPKIYPDRIAVKKEIEKRFKQLFSPPKNNLRKKTGSLVQRIYQQLRSYL